MIHTSERHTPNSRAHSAPARHASQRPREPANPRDHAHHARQMQSSAYSASPHYRAAASQTYARMCHNSRGPASNDTSAAGYATRKDTVATCQSTPTQQNKAVSCKPALITHPHHPCTGAGARCHRTRSHMHRGGPGAVGRSAAALLGTCLLYTSPSPRDS